MSESSNPENPTDISELQENFSEQQKKISILKELVRQSETTHSKATSAAQEKVKNIAQRLTQLKIKTKSKRQEGDSFKKKQTLSEGLPSPVVGRDVEDVVSEQTNMSLPMYVSTPNPSPLKPETQRSTSITSVHPVSSGNEKVQLLKQQMEQSKALLAQRTSSKQHLEQLVVRLKEQLDSTQQNLDNAAELGRSMNDLSVINVSAPREHFKSTNDLVSQQPFSLEKERIKFLENRCRLLEKQLEKEKKLNTSQMSSEAEKEKLEAVLNDRIKDLEITMHNLQLEKENREKGLIEENERLKIEIENLEKFTSKETFSKSEPEQEPNSESLSFDLQDENQRLSKENKEYLKRLNDLEQVNIMLENERFNLTEKNSQLEAKLEDLQKQFESLQQQLKDTEEELLQTKAQVNEVMEINSTVSETVKIEENVTAEMAKQIQEMRDEISELNQTNTKLKEDLEESNKMEVSEESISEKMSNYEEKIKKLEETIKSQEELIKNQEEDIMEKSIELNVLNANFKVLEEKLEETSKKTLFITSRSDDSTKTAALEEENQQLKHKLDEANKLMIKLKLKCKKAEKEMENVAKITKEKDLLQQKVIELEEEKGQWQLSQVEDSGLPSSDNKNSNQENTLEAKYQSLSALYDDLQKENESLLQKLSALEEEKHLPVREEGSDRIKSELSEVKIEEELQQMKEKLGSLEKQLETKQNEIDSYKIDLGKLELKKIDLEKKLENYIHENIELMDKVEKLSKSSSSAESIEIVERLTQQEHLELEKAYAKNMQSSQTGESISTGINEITQTDISPELNESLTKLRDESAELMNKIELFTSERREVLEKMERLTNENSSLQQKLDEANEQKDLFEKDLNVSENKRDKLESQLNDLVKEKQILSNQIQDSIASKAKLDQELSTLRQMREVMPALEPEESVALLDNCEKSLDRLHHELESYRKVNDKNSKFNISKKLAKEAKNAHTQFSQLLRKVREASTAVETVTVFETVVAVTAANGEDLAKYEELSQQNQMTSSDIEGTKAQLARYEKECLELKAVVEDLTHQLSASRSETEEKTNAINRLNIEIESLQKISEDFDKISHDKDMSHKEQIENLNRLRKELEAKCETYKGEMEILKSLVNEQKEQLIETYKEHENEINLKLSELKDRDDCIQRLEEELIEIKKASKTIGNKFKENLEKECEDLREALKANKEIIAEQLEDLCHKQETIDTLNQQIIDLYKAMEETTNQMNAKEKEISAMQIAMAKNQEEIVRLMKENDEQKAVVDKLLIELHTNKLSPGISEEVAQLQNEIQLLRQTNEELRQAKIKQETVNKEQLEKLKKYAANLKKRNSQVQELEAKLREVGQSSLLACNTLSEDQQSLVEKLEAKIDELQNALESKTVQHLDSMELRQSLEKECNELKKHLEERHEECKHLKENQRKALDDFNMMKHKLEECERENEVYRKDFNSLQDNLKQLEANYKQQEANIAHLETIKSDLEKSISEKDHFIMNSKDHLNIVNDLREQKEVLEKENLQLKEDLKNKSLKFDKSRAIIKERTVKIQNLQKHIKELEDKLAATKEEEEEVIVPQMVSNVESSPFSKEKYEKLQNDFNDLMQRYSNEKASFEETIYRLNSLHDGIQAKLQQDLSSIERLEQENAFLKDKIKDLENDLQEKSQKLNILNEKISSFGDLENNLQTSHLENETLRNSLAEMKNHLNLLNQENQTIKKDLKRIPELEAQLNEKSLEHSSLLEKISKIPELENQVHSKTLEIEQMKEHLSHLDYLKSQIEAKTNENHNLLQEISKISQLEKLLETKTFEEENLNQQLKQTKEDYNVLLKDLESSRLLNDQQEKDILILKENIQTLQEAKKKLEDDLASSRQIENDFMALQEKIGLVEKVKADFEQQLSTYQAQDNAIHIMKENIESLLQSKVNLEDQLAFFQRQENDILVLRENVKTLEQAKAELEEQLYTFQRQENDLLALRDNVRSLEQSEAELEELLASSRRQNEVFQQEHAELQELRSRSLQEQKEIENLRLHLDNTVANYETELQNLRTQINEMDNLRMQVGQNQTDDQVFIEFENKRLTDLLAEKEALIENYQRQNLQLQMMASSASHQESNFNEEKSQMEQSLKEKSELITKLQQEIATLKEANGPTHLSHSNEASNPVESIPPPIFFTSDNSSAASLFDEIIIPQQSQANFFAPNATATSQQPSLIEDLQKNVSDLEKHAKDLENKLALCHQREKDYDLSLRDLQNKLKSSEDRYNETERKIKDLEERLNAAQNENQQAQANVNFLDHELQQVQNLLSQSEIIQKDLQEQLKKMESASRHTPDLIVDNSERLLKESSKDFAKDESGSKQPESDLNMFFGIPPSSSEFDNLFAPQANQPVVEDVIKPTKFYKCHEDENILPPPPPPLNSQFEPFLSNQPETFTFASFSAPPAETSHHSSLSQNDLQKQINDLKEALALSNQQKDELNTKSLKLMKKLKEFKQKNDELKALTSSNSSVKEKNSFFDGLDAAIEDELKSQITKLELKLKDQEKQLEEQALEKSKLLKRIDVLVSGNERMTEMKERQDLEVQMYKARIQELQAKLSNLEDWGNDSGLPSNQSNDSSKPSVPSLDSNLKEVYETQINDLNMKIEELTIENEDLKVKLLQEKPSSSSQEENLKLLEKLKEQDLACEELKQSYHHLEEKFNLLHLENEQLQNHSIKATENEESLKQQISELLSDLEKFKTQSAAYKIEINQLQEQLSQLESLNNHLSQQHQENSFNKDLEKKLNLAEEAFAYERISYQNKIKDLEKSLENLQSFKSSNSNVLQNPADLLAELQEKESEITHLKQRIDDLMREDQTEKLVLEILTKNQDIHLLKMKVKHLEDDKLDLEAQIQALSSSTKSFEPSSSELQSLQQQNSDLLQTIQELEKSLKSLQEEKTQMEAELEVLNQHVLKNLEEEDKLKSIILELDLKNIEIAELRKSLESRPNSNSDIESSLNAKWESIVDEKCKEVATMWQLHLQQREEFFKATENLLRSEIDSLKDAFTSSNPSETLPSNLAVSSQSPQNTSTSPLSNESTNSKPSLALTDDSEDSSAIIAKMQAALESQEVEIVTLKEQLAIRSAEYARLAAQYDPFKLQNTLSHSNSNVISTSNQDSPSSRARYDASTVPKSDLDLALYIIHQRDMRIEEMTLELVNLLEERDTLQLKLSNTLRKLEETKTLRSSGDASPAGEEATATASQQPESLSSNPETDNDDLTQKLSQLQRVDHSKDKMIKEEREQRIRQMERIQQDVAKIPQAAVYELVGQDLSDSGQSPSSVLLNWLWGNKNNENNNSFNS